MATAEAPRASTASSEPPDGLPARRRTDRATAGRRGRQNAPLALYLVPGGLLYVTFVLWPLFQIMWLALHRWDGYGPQTWVGLANFPTLWNDDIFRTSLAHTLV
jgi:ABC-type sugar transport system permease subunit